MSIATFDSLSNPICTPTNYLEVDVASISLRSFTRNLDYTGNDITTMIDFPCNQTQNLFRVKKLYLY